MTIEITKEIYDYQILNLAESFYKDYPYETFPEIAWKKERPYSCLLLQSHYGYFICIPYRSQVKHKNAYLFKRSKRSKKKASGLDYSKTLIIANPEYIETRDAIIDQDEYNETRDNIHHIVNDALRYIDDYILHITGRSTQLDSREFQRKYEYTTLKYFHEILFKHHF